MQNSFKHLLLRNFGHHCLPEIKVYMTFNLVSVCIHVFSLFVLLVYHWAGAVVFVRAPRCAGAAVSVPLAVVPLWSASCLVKADGRLLMPL
jgi:hypothetical protein